MQKYELTFSLTAAERKKLNIIAEKQGFTLDGLLNTWLSDWIEEFEQEHGEITEEKIAAMQRKSRSNASNNSE